VEGFAIPCCGEFLTFVGTRVRLLYFPTIMEGDFSADEYGAVLTIE